MRTDELDPHEVGDFMLDYWSGEWNANLTQRAGLSDDAAILDIDYTSIRDNAFDVITDIYRSRGESLSAEARTAMAGWEETHHPRSGDYQHSADYYGLTPQRVETAFANYLERFAVKPGSAVLARDLPPSVDRETGRRSRSSSGYFCGAPCLILRGLMVAATGAALAVGDVTTFWLVAASTYVRPLPRRKEEVA